MVPLPRSHVPLRNSQRPSSTRRWPSQALFHSLGFFHSTPRSVADWQTDSLCVWDLRYLTKTDSQTDSSCLRMATCLPVHISALSTTHLFRCAYLVVCLDDNVLQSPITGSSLRHLANGTKGDERLGKMPHLRSFVPEMTIHAPHAKGRRSRAFKPSAIAVTSITGVRKRQHVPQST